ncbi:MAG: hypothetical protein LBG87_03390 [Spirochaetaceae bacterium]|jgi:hypothetical protein|nr:hypothetical protein [Spirochaetaceae bacterium]
MPDMTEEEYDALDELLTKTTPKVSGDGKNGFFMQHKDEIVILDDVSAVYIGQNLKPPAKRRRKLSASWCGKK